MTEGIKLFVAGEVEDKRSFAVDDGHMYCITVVGRGFTHDQYVTAEVYEAAPAKGELITLVGEAKVNKKGSVTIGMKSAQIAQQGKRSRMAA